MRKYLLAFSFIFYVIFSWGIYGLDIKLDILSEFSVADFKSDSLLLPVNSSEFNTYSLYLSSLLTIKSEFGKAFGGSLKLQANFQPVDFFNSKVRENISLNELFINVYTNYFLLRLGKQFIKWGSSVFFNPIDIISLNKNPLSNTNIVQGMPFLELKFPVNDLLDLSAIAIIDASEARNLYELPFVLKTSVFLDMLNFFVFTILQKDKKPVYGLNADLAGGLTNNFIYKFYSEISYKGESDRVRFVENNGSYNIRKYPDDNYLAWVMGMSMGYSFNNSFVNKFSLSLEYYYNAENWSKEDFFVYTKYLKELTSIGVNDLKYFSIFKNSRYYLYFSVRLEKLLNLDLSLAFNLIYNIEDRGIILMPFLNYFFTDNMYLSGQLQFYYGDKDSEFYNFYINTMAIISLKVII